jgi:16S rRNA processing protein RimM
MKKELIPIGKIVKCQGTKGHVRLFPFIEDLALNEYAGEISTSDSSGTVLKRRIASIRPNKKFWIIHFEGVNCIDEAQALVGQKVAVNRTFFRKLPAGNYYWFEILGLEVYDEKDAFLGKIDNFFSTGGNDVYVVKNDKRKEFFVPAIKEIVKQVDLKKNKMVIHVVTGL